MDDLWRLFLFVEAWWIHGKWASVQWCVRLQWPGEFVKACWDVRGKTPGCMSSDRLNGNDSKCHQVYIWAWRGVFHPIRTCCLVKYLAKAVTINGLHFHRWRFLCKWVSLFWMSHQGEWFIKWVTESFLFFFLVAEGFHNNNADTEKPFPYPSITKFTIIKQKCYVGLCYLIIYGH